VLCQHLNNSMNIVWWNGPSFRHTMHIPPQEMEIGCNFIQNHRPVRHVCAFDRQCVERIKNKPDVKFWTRASVVNDRYPHFKHLQSETNYYDSGTLALAVAMKHCVGPVYLVGCDWGETNSSIYDKLYTWRAQRPGKQTTAKCKLIEHMSKQIELIFVHDRPKDCFGSQVKWIKIADFLDLAL